ncbi:MAG TPA: DUF433 domain-containing protein [Chloroflexota bacterium]|nr:DUF433 domain-containing protein [Chloroflexota bacterium]
MTTEDPYVEARGDRYYVRGHRVPLIALAVMWKDGASPETIHENYPTLSLAQVLGGLAFYLEHQDQVDADLKADEADFERAREAARAANPGRYAELEARVAALRNRRAVAQS